MKIKTSELSGRALDAAVEMALGNKIKVKTWRELTDALDPIKDADDIAYYRERGTVRLSYVDKISGAVFPARGFSSDWAQGGPIIERANITIIRTEDESIPDEEGFWQGKYEPRWAAVLGDRHHPQEFYGAQGDFFGMAYEVDPAAVIGPTPLIAAMRCFVASKMGDEVDVPDELVPKPQADHQASVEDEARRPSPRERGG